VNHIVLWKSREFHRVNFLSPEELHLIIAVSELSAATEGLENFIIQLGLSAERSKKMSTKLVSELREV